MSSLIRQSHKTNDQPLWLATSGGVIDGSIICEGSLIADSDILLRTGIPKTTTSRLASNPAGTLYLQGANINFSQIGSIGNTNITTSATGANLDVLGVGGTINATGAVNAFTLNARQDATNGGTAHYVFSDLAGVIRWGLGLQPAETGGNAGADLHFYSYADNGAFIGSPLVLTRATGEVTIPATLTAGNLSISSFFDGTGLPSPVAAGTAQTGKATIANGTTNVVINTTQIAANSIVLVTRRNAAAAGPGSGPAGEALTVPTGAPFIVPGASFTVQLVDPTTGIIVAAANGDVNFDFVIINT